MMSVTSKLFFVSQMCSDVFRHVGLWTAIARLKVVARLPVDLIENAHHVEQISFGKPPFRSPKVSHIKSVYQSRNKENDGGWVMVNL